MNCRESRDLLHAYADDELDAADARELDLHLKGCGPCLHAFETARVVKAAVAQPSLYYPAPDGLRRDTHRQVRRDAPRSPRLARWSSLGVAAALLISTLLWGTWHLADQATVAQADQGQVLASHLRSLQVPHALVDVASTDQHTVKPWFQAHLDYSPPVRQLASEGFPLEGGRLDYVHDRAVAAMVYRRGQHVISLFVWPGESAGAVDVSERGIHLLHWSSGGMTFWAVSDLNASELRDFRGLLRAADTPH